MAVGLQIGSSGSTTTLSYIQIGSDELNENMRRVRSGVMLERYGVPIGMRIYKNARIWTLNINAAPKSHIENLRQFYLEGTFWLIPNTSNLSVKYKVVWVGDFNPVPVRGGDYYSLQGTFKERI